MAVVIDPADFGGRINNPHYTLKPGTTHVFEGDSKDGHLVGHFTVTHNTVTILGVTCVEVIHTETVDGELIERTRDWFAQDKQGNVWYFGELLPVRAHDSLSPVHVVKWFDYMTDRGAWIVSCSWEAEAVVYPLPERVSHAISRCAREGRNGKGCVVVFAAGNSRRSLNNMPHSLSGYATHPEVIAVAASTSVDTHADYSNFGSEIAVCAPSGGFGGWNIITSDVAGTYIDSAGVEHNSGYGSGEYYFHFTGTSSACPLVAGVCALVLGANPHLAAAEVRDIVKLTARKICAEEEYDEQGHSAKFGHGCVDAERAVKEAIRRLPLVADVTAPPVLEPV